MESMAEFERYLQDLSDYYVSLLLKKGTSVNVEVEANEVVGRDSFCLEKKSDFLDENIHSLCQKYPRFSYLTKQFFYSQIPLFSKQKDFFNSLSRDFQLSENEKEVKKKFRILNLLSKDASSEDCLLILDWLEAHLSEQTDIYNFVLIYAQIYEQAPKAREKVLSVFSQMLEICQQTGTSPIEKNEIIINFFKLDKRFLPQILNLLQKNAKKNADPGMSEVVHFLLKKRLDEAKFFKHVSLSGIPDDYEEMKNFHRFRYLNADEYEQALHAMGIDKMKKYDFSLSQRILPRLFLRFCRLNGFPLMSYSQSVSIVRKREKDWTCLWKANSRWLSFSALALAEVFGLKFDAYLNKVQPYLSLHDSSFFLNGLDYGNPKNKKLGEFLMNNVVYQNAVGSRILRKLNELGHVVRFWKNIDMDKHLSFEGILNLSLSEAYPCIMDEKFSKEAAYWRVPVEDYSYLEQLYLNSLGVLEPFDTSKIYKNGNFIGRFLPRKDVRVGFFGQYTDCCQHYLGVGKTAAISSVKDDFSQLFVVEKEGRIIAGSFVWLAKKGKNVLGVCFDSVEALTAYKERPELFSIYKQVVLDLNKIYPTITFGMNNFSLNRADRKLPIPLNVYSDARVQFVLNENQNRLY